MTETITVEEYRQLVETSSRRRLAYQPRATRADWCEERLDGRRVVTITFHGERPPSLNDYYGAHWSKRHRLTTEIKELAGVLLAGAKRDLAPFDRPVRATWTAYFAATPLDWTNVLVKPYEDALIGWLLEDDSPAWIVSGTVRSRIDADAPRLSVRLESTIDKF